MKIYFTGGVFLETDLLPEDLYVVWRAVLSKKIRANVSVRLGSGYKYVDIDGLDPEATFGDLLRDAYRDTEPPIAFSG